MSLARLRAADRFFGLHCGRRRAARPFGKIGNGAAEVLANVACGKRKASARFCADSRRAARRLAAAAARNYANEAPSHPNGSAHALRRIGSASGAFVAAPRPATPSTVSSTNDGAEATPYDQPIPSEAAAVHDSLSAAARLPPASSRRIFQSPMYSGEEVRTSGNDDAKCFLSLGGADWRVARRPTPSPTPRSHWRLLMLTNRRAIHFKRAAVNRV